MFRLRKMLRSIAERASPETKGNIEQSALDGVSCIETDALFQTSRAAVGSFALESYRSFLTNSADGRTYSGWDLVVDREKGGGYPDALLLGTPPYGSLNEREIGTTFGMRAQDAIAWEPRRFHFLTSLKDWTRARELFPEIMGGVRTQQTSADLFVRNQAANELLQIVGRNSGPRPIASGELSVLDARLKSGVSDPPFFALQWAAHLGQVPHKLEQADAVPSLRGELLWFRFAVTLWLPDAWKTPRGFPSEAASCAQ